ncbi:MAG: Helix-turn-helix domain [Acidimicrobiaceae bacterium]|jgi:excisionase family DNA binding protein|nr:Helix-turn-helix domain [Acidimicrobiaceae bacterium]MDQ1420685.1 Helix-turn-helix domain [Acidimicrobiaceae bacterium]
MQDLLRTSDVAALFQVSTRTVSEWARRGRVPCMRTPGGQWRYPAEPIRRLVNRVEHAPWEELAPTDGRVA